MPARTELDRLAAARPALLDHTERVVDADQEDRILRQILRCAGSAGAPSAARARAGQARSTRRLRSPRLASAVVGGAATVALAAVGVLAGTGAFRNGAAGSGAVGHGGTAAGGVHAVSAETMADRTIAALTETSRAGIEYSRTVFANGAAGSTAAIEDWSYGISERAKWYSAQGSLTWDGSAVVSHGLRIRRFVDYTSRTWQQDSIPVAGYGAGPGLTAAVDATLGVPRAGIHRQPGPRSRPGASRGVITLVNVNGTQMFQVTTRWPAASFAGEQLPLPAFTNPMAVPAATVSRVFSETVWIDAASYLPVRVAVTGPGGRVLASQTFAWLTPDRANRAELTPAPVPAGFRETQEPAH